GGLARHRPRVVRSPHDRAIAPWLDRCGEQNREGQHVHHLSADNPIERFRGKELLMNPTDTTDSAPPAPPRLLVVEDDTTVREFCVRLLRMNRYQVSAAENGMVALERLKENRYDLVLTDLQMPEMSG